MKKLLLLTFLLAESILLSAQSNYTINEAWNFSLEGEETTKIVSFPHTWNDKDAIDETPGYFRGTALYKRNVFIGSEAVEKTTYIRFYGANQVTKLFVNKQLVGTHKGGYTQFVFDITNYIKPQSFNLFEIQVDNSHDVNIPPLSADFTFFGGIYRDVSLEFKPKVHISPEDFASSGVYVSTPKVSEKEATIEAKVVLRNSLKQIMKVDVMSEVISPKGDIVSQTKQTVSLPALASNEINLKFAAVNNPSLWSPDSPSLYTLRTTLIDPQNKKVTEVVNETFGFRWFEFDADKGFSLNGKQLKLIGTNRHQCREDIGNAMSDKQHIQDIVMLKNMGANFLRISHYPQDPLILKMCDKLGIITTIEIPIVNAVTESQEFLDNSLYMTEEMVKQNYNSASLVIWAYMNEVLLKPPYKDKAKRADYYVEVRRQAVAIDDLLRKLDKNRYTMLPFHADYSMYVEANLITVPQIAGWNLYQGWYFGQLEDFGKFLDRFHSDYPKVPFIVTEYGADVDPRLHSFSPVKFDYTAEFGNKYHEIYLKEILKRPFVAGANIWNFNDFYSEARRSAMPHINNKGIVSLGREPKDTYFLYQAHLLKTPYIKIGSQSWKDRAGVADQNATTSTQPIKIYTNMKDVIIYHNMQMLGKFNAVDNIVTASIPFVQGENKIKVTGVLEQSGIEDNYVSNFMLVPSSFTSAVEFKEMNVMLGSCRYFEEKISDVCWIPEQEYTPGSWGYVGGAPMGAKTSNGEVHISELDILGTSMNPIFQTQRVDIKEFKADLPNGEYYIYLYWAHLVPDKQKEALAYSLGSDPVYETGGEYAFNVFVNGNEILNNFDIPKQIGAERAIIKKVIVSATNGSGISVKLESVGGKTFLNAIRIVKVD